MIAGPDLVTTTVDHTNSWNSCATVGTPFVRTRRTLIAGWRS